MVYKKLMILIKHKINSLIFKNYIVIIIGLNKLIKPLKKTIDHLNFQKIDAF